MNTLIQQVQQLVDAGVVTDMNEVTTGGGFKIWPEGNAIARLIWYIETGNHAQKDHKSGVMKAPTPQMKMAFAMFSPNYTQDDGSPGIIISYDTTISQSEKANATKIFKKMNWKGTAKHFSQFLTEPFIINIKQRKDATAKVVGSYVDLKEISAPVEPLSKQPYSCPEVSTDLLKLFMWDTPTKEMWDSLFIDGTRDDGSSKNWLQEQIMKATNFPGSPIEQLIFGSNAPALPSMTAQAVPTACTMPAAAAVPAIPPPVASAAVPATGVPDLPLSAPTAPAAPAMPTVPAAPAAAVLPSVPTVPSAGTVPQVPPAAVQAAPARPTALVAPVVPSAPSAAQVPAAPAVPWQA